MSLNRGEWEPIALISMKDPWLWQWRMTCFSSLCPREGSTYERGRVTVWVCQQCNSRNSLNSSNMLQFTEQWRAEGSFNLAADSQQGIQPHFSLLSSTECASFQLKASDFHFQIRPSVILVFQHYQYSHSKPCKVKLENKKRSDSCKKCCKC